MLSGGTQRRALPRQQSEMKILNFSFPRVAIEPTTRRAYVIYKLGNIIHIISTYTCNKNVTDRCQVSTRKTYI